jgi:protein-S-isoprenylcysteine O-methyltransferase Ste14
LALGLFLNFVWPMRFLARTDALWLGALLIVVSIPIVIGAAWQLTKAMLLALPLALILQKGVIEPEEHYLEQKFGETYLHCKARVRRWI